MDGATERSGSRGRWLWRHDSACVLQAGRGGVPYTGKRHSGRFRGSVSLHLSITALVALWYLGVSITLQAHGDELEQVLYRHKQLAIEGGCSSGQSDQGLLELEGRHRQSEELGRIYAVQAEIYAQGPCRDQQQTIKYARKALEETIEPRSAMRMCQLIGAAIHLESSNNGGRTAAVSRQEAALSLLQGIQVASENDVPEKRQDLITRPGGLRGGGPAYEDALKKRAAQLEAWEAQEHTNEMIELREQMERDLVFLYAKSADGKEELKTLAEQELNDQISVDRILKKLQIAEDVEAGRPIQWPSVLYTDMPREFFEKTTGKTIGQED